MSKFQQSKAQQQINSVLVYHDKELKSIQFPSKEMDAAISNAEALLERVGYTQNIQERALPVSTVNRHVSIPTWDELYSEAERQVGHNCSLDDLFTAEELRENNRAIRNLNEEYKSIYQLDKGDVAIAALAGMLGATVDILLVGVPQKSKTGLQAGPLSNYIRDYFDEIFPEEEMKKLANKKISKVPYDAQDNRNTSIRIEGLSAYYHRLLQLGHDPLLGFLFGVSDIMTGRMTTIDKSGNIVSQVMENYVDRKETDIFAAIAKQILHLKTDVTTSMGLPVPLMSLFNLLQVGNIGDEDQTIAEIVQGMYYEGYDFIHFCSMSIPVMIVEVVVRMGYALKRMNEGFSIKESIPFSTNRAKHPKLATMLFIGHSAATAFNAGRVYLTKSPMTINYPQWIAFAKHSYFQLRWALLEKPVRQNDYVLGRINEELDSIFYADESAAEEFKNIGLIIMN